MSIEGLVISLLILILSAAWVIYPMVSSEMSSEAIISDKEHDRLLTLYSQVMSTIRDMDDDYAAGKLQQHEYEQERKLWAERGVEVLKALDQNEAVSIASNGHVSDSIDDAIEAAVANYRRQ